MKIKITDDFLSGYRKLVREQMLPFQWNALNDIGGICVERERNDDNLPAQKSHAIANFEIAAGRQKGEHFGWVFQDSDVYKWLEAAAYSLMEEDNDDLKEKADYVVDLIKDAQQPDGYIHTYYTINGLEERYTRMTQSHELYCAGHFFEAACAYYTATHNETVLDTAKKWADHLCDAFGKEPGKICGYDGHEEVKIGLMKLYDLTGEDKYLRLAEFFLDIRGVQDNKDDNFLVKQYRDYPDAKDPISAMPDVDLSYFQADKPVVKMTEAHGHAVRVVYLCNALARIAHATGREELKQSAKRLFENITEKQMYITGGIGATVHGEAFTFDYDLPNDTMYCETCASVGLFMFAHQMLNIEADGKYADVMERAFYNTCLASVALDGKHFFYVNPLYVNPKSFKGDVTKGHVKPVRPEWLGCACCPPNLARLITSLDKYMYVQHDSEILSLLFASGKAEFEVSGGTVTVKQQTDYPQSGNIRYEVILSDSIVNECKEVKLGIRIPSWAGSIKADVSGEGNKGFLYVTCKGKETVINVEFPMNIRRWHANLNVRADSGKTAVSRGPFIYCLEEADNGDNLHLLSLPEDAELTYTYDESLLGGVGVIEGTGLKKTYRDTCGELYFSGSDRIVKVPAKLKFIPYYAWANRGENEMQVWIAEN